MDERFFLSSESFNVEVCRGAISSLRNNSSIKSSEFVLPDTLFGELILTYKTEGADSVIWKCNRTSSYKDETPVKDGLKQVYEWSAEDGPLTVTSKIEVIHNKLKQVYSIKNTSDTPATIDDVFEGSGTTEYMEIKPGDYMFNVMVEEKATGTITASKKPLPDD